MFQPFAIHLGRTWGSVLAGASLLLVTTSVHAENNTDYIFNVGATNIIGTYKVPASGSGTNDSLQILNGASVTNTGHVSLGDLSSASNNYAIVSGTNSILSVGINLYVGNDGRFNTFTVTNGGLVSVTGDGLIGNSAAAFGNQVFVDGPGSTLTVSNSGKFYYIGVSSTSNQTTVSNGGQLLTYGLRVGHAGSGGLLTVNSGGKVDVANVLTVGYFGDYNTISVNGSNSLVRALSFDVGNGGQSASAFISNGAHVESTYAYLGQGAGASNALVIVSGPGSLLSNTSDTAVGYSANSARLVITNGGRVETGSGIAKVGYGGLLFNRGSSAEVTGNGSTWNAGVMFIGEYSPDNTLVISNGGSVTLSGRLAVGVNPQGSNNNVVVTGPGSLLRSASLVSVGNNGGYSQGSNSFLRVTDGATLESSDLRGGTTSSHGAISNVGGIYQFTSASPAISGAVSLDGGTISYRDVASADINNAQVGNISKQGDNTFQFNNSTNAAASYTFDTGNPSNYYRLVLVNGGNLWQGANLNVGNNGKLLASNTIGRVSALVTNLGMIEVYHSTMTFVSNVVINGKYISDPSTNYFMADLTVNQSGTLAGGVGDRFEFIKSSLLIHSTNNTGFNLASSSVAFTGGGMHTNAITGVDLGSNVTAFASAFEAQNNFAYGELHLGSTTDQVCFTCGNIPTIASDGLYVGWLDLLGNANLWTNLHAAAGINIYYNQTDSRNAYLGGLSYQLTDCNFVAGGGWLYPVIPEPSALAFLSMGSILFLWRKQR